MANNCDLVQLPSSDRPESSSANDDHVVSGENKQAAMELSVEAVEVGRQPVDDRATEQASEEETLSSDDDSSTAVISPEQLTLHAINSVLLNDSFISAVFSGLHAKTAPSLTTPKSSHYSTASGQQLADSTELTDENDPEPGEQESATPQSTSDSEDELETGPLVLESLSSSESKTDCQNETNNDDQQDFSLLNDSSDSSDDDQMADVGNNQQAEPSVDLHVAIEAQFALRDGTFNIQAPSIDKENEADSAQIKSEHWNYPPLSLHASSENIVGHCSDSENQASSDDTPSRHSWVRSQFNFYDEPSVPFNSPEITPLNQNELIGLGQGTSSSDEIDNESIRASVSSSVNSKLQATLSVDKPIDLMESLPVSSSSNEGECHWDVATQVSPSLAYLPAARDEPMDLTVTLPVSTSSSDEIDTFDASTPIGSSAAQTSTGSVSSSTTTEEEPIDLTVTVPTCTGSSNDASSSQVALPSTSVTNTEELPLPVYTEMTDPVVCGVRILIQPPPTMAIVEHNNEIEMPAENSVSTSEATTQNVVDVHAKTVETEQATTFSKEAPSPKQDSKVKAKKSPTVEPRKNRAFVLFQAAKNAKNKLLGRQEKKLSEVSPKSKNLALPHPVASGKHVTPTKPKPETQRSCNSPAEKRELSNAAKMKSNLPSASNSPPNSQNKVAPTPKKKKSLLAKVLLKNASAPKAPAASKSN